MEKVYMVLEENYNLLANENGASYIYGCYNTKEKAISYLIQDIKKSINEDEWLLDENDVEYLENPKDFLENNYVRLFWRHQENWDYYCELSIKELEVK